MPTACQQRRCWQAVMTRRSILVCCRPDLPTREPHPHQRRTNNPALTSRNALYPTENQQRVTEFCWRCVRSLKIFAGSGDRIGAVLAAWRHETNRLPPQRLRSARPPGVRRRPHAGRRAVRRRPHPSRGRPPARGGPPKRQQRVRDEQRFAGLWSQQAGRVRLRSAAGLAVRAALFADPRTAAYAALGELRHLPDGLWTETRAAALVVLQSEDTAGPPVPSTAE